VCSKVSRIGVIDEKIEAKQLKYRRVGRLQPAANSVIFYVG